MQQSHRKGAAKKSGFWSKRDLKILTRMHAKGSKQHIIGAAVGRNQMAVHRQLKKMGLLVENDICHACGGKIIFNKIQLSRKYCSDKCRATVNNRLYRLRSAQMKL